MGTLISMLNLGVRNPPQRFDARALRGLGLAPDGYVKLTFNQVLAVERHLSTLASALLGALVAAPRRQKPLDSEIKGLSDHAHGSVRQSCRGLARVSKARGRGFQGQTPPNVFSARIRSHPPCPPSHPRFHPLCLLKTCNTPPRSADTIIQT